MIQYVLIAWLEDKIIIALHFFAINQVTANNMANDYLKHIKYDRKRLFESHGSQINEIGMY